MFRVIHGDISGNVLHMPTGLRMPFVHEVYKHGVGPFLSRLVEKVGPAKFKFNIRRICTREP